jgi:hypothetical protein
MAFFGMYGNPMMRRVGETHNFSRTLKDKDELVHLPDVQAALANMSRGGIPEAIIRMLVLVAEARGAVSGARLERAAYTFTHSPQFATVNAARRARLLREQTVIVLFDRDNALATLAELLPDMDARAIAVGTIDYIVGLNEMIEAHTIETLEEIRSALELPRVRLGKEELEALSAVAEKDGSTIEAA